MQASEQAQRALSEGELANTKTRDCVADPRVSARMAHCERPEASQLGEVAVLKLTVDKSAQHHTVQVSREPEAPQDSTAAHHNSTSAMPVPPQENVVQTAEKLSHMQLTVADTTADLTASALPAQSLTAAQVVVPSLCDSAILVTPPTSSKSTSSKEAITLVPAAQEATMPLEQAPTSLQPHGTPACPSVWPMLPDFPTSGTSRPRTTKPPLKRDQPPSPTATEPRLTSSKRVRPAQTSSSKQAVAEDVFVFREAEAASANQHRTQRRTAGAKQQHTLQRQGAGKDHENYIPYYYLLEKG
jgi:hypothetical protein